MATSFIILLLTAIGIALLTVKSRDGYSRIPLKKLGFASLGLAALYLVSASITIIEPGYVGVPVTFGTVGSQSLPAGLHPIFFLTDVYKMSIQTKDYTMSSAKNEGPGGRGGRFRPVWLSLTTLVLHDPSGERGRGDPVGRLER